MDPEIRAQFDETRRHLDVIAEGMRAEVRLEEIRETRRDLTALLTARS
jgi:hypothetical protein